jgi:hypothetical protein
LPVRGPKREKKFFVSHCFSNVPEVPARQV